MSESLTGRTLKGAAWIGGASVARLALRVVSVAVLARLLTPHEYGVIAGALIAMELAAMVYAMGLAPTLIQRKDVRSDHVATAFSSALFLAALAAAGMWFAAPLIADVMQIPELTEILKVLAWLTPFGAFSILCEALLARHMQVKSVALRPLVSFTFATFLVAIPMAWYGFGYWSLVAMQAVDTIVGALVLGIAARSLLAWPRFSRRAFNELWKLSLGFTLNQPFGYVARNADKFLIGRFLGADSLGVYTRASFITTTAANLFGNVTRLSVFPAMAQVQEDGERLRNALLKSLSVLALLTLPTTAICVLFANELVGLLLGPQWGAAVAPFAILAGSLYLRLAWRVCAAVFQALGRPNRITAIHILRAAALVVSIWFVQPYGLAAISAAVVAVMAVVLGIMFVVVARDIDLGLHRVAAVHLRPLVISGAVLGVGMMLKASLASVSGPVLLAITLVVLLAGLLPIILFWKKRVLGSYLPTLTRRTQGEL
jgi:O-antigen/teichoic acid export membrane protein